MMKVKKQNQVIGYLPDETPSPLKLFLYAVQQVIVMFPATVAVALITGFQISTTIFASGLATICFIFITGRKIPLYYGSSFSYLSAISGLLAGESIKSYLSQETLDGIVAWSSGASNVIPAEAISYVQFGIIMSGFISIIAGLLIKLVGVKAVEKILPPSITGSIAMIIGLTLAGTALSDAAPKMLAEGATATIFNSDWIWIVSLSTLLSTVVFTRYLKGFLGQIPLLLGAAVGCIVAGLMYVLGGDSMNIFRTISNAPDTVFAIPAFTFPKASWAAVVAIMHSSLLL